MKQLFILTLLTFFFHQSHSQTKILDAAVNWTSPQTLTIFLTDTLVSSVNVQLGTSFEGINITNATYTVGSTISCADNMLVVPLSGVMPGSYYVDVRVTMVDASIQEIQFQCAD